MSIIFEQRPVYLVKDMVGHVHKVFGIKVAAESYVAAFDGRLHIDEWPVEFVRRRDKNERNS